MKIFWAWQSDLPGEVSTYLVRDALLGAIDKLKQSPDIEEPTEEARRNDIHLDSDRQGLSGCPDLARAILEKIDASAVFVGDVTPVGKGPPTISDDGTMREGKPLMNPNVAIELGYAIAKLTDTRILMVLNTANGNRDGLPFDIKQKGGPIMYHLAVDAAKDEVTAEKARLISKLVPALAAFKPVEAPAASSTFKETPPKIGKAFYFGDGEVLGKSKHNAASPDPVEFVMPFRSVFYMRVIPTKPLDRPLPMDMLFNNTARYGAFGSGVGNYIRENEYGIAILNPAGNTTNIDSMTQYFRNGEIWGINVDVLRQGERGEQLWLISHGVEHTFAESLNLYFEFLRDVSKIAPPYVVEAGMCGVKGRLLVNSGTTLGSAGKVFEDSFELRRVLHNTDLATQDKFLLEFFELMHNQTGHPRPHKLYGFPPDRAAART
jgi:hypothetical protein